jgi:hypothetical protein
MVFSPVWSVRAPDIARSCESGDRLKRMTRLLASMTLVRAASAAPASYYYPEEVGTS